LRAQTKYSSLMTPPRSLCSLQKVILIVIIARTQFQDVRRHSFAEIIGKINFLPQIYVGF
jgi:hypothetical protein